MTDFIQPQNLPRLQWRDGNADKFTRTFNFQNAGAGVSSITVATTEPNEITIHPKDSIGTNQLGFVRLSGKEKEIQYPIDFQIRYKSNTGQALTEKYRVLSVEQNPELIAAATNTTTSAPSTLPTAPQNNSKVDNPVASPNSDKKSIRKKEEENAGLRLRVDGKATGKSKQQSVQSESGIVKRVVRSISAMGIPVLKQEHMEETTRTSSTEHKSKSKTWSIAITLLLLLTIPMLAKYCERPPPPSDEDRFIQLQFNNFAYKIHSYHIGAPISLDARVLDSHGNPITSLVNQFPMEDTCNPNFEAPAPDPQTFKAFKVDRLIIFKLPSREKQFAVELRLDVKGFNQKSRSYYPNPVSHLTNVLVVIKGGKSDWNRGSYAFSKITPPLVGTDDGAKPKATTHPFVDGKLDFSVHEINLKQSQEPHPIGN